MGEGEDLSTFADRGKGFERGNKCVGEGKLVKQNYKDNGRAYRLSEAGRGLYLRKTEGLSLDACANILYILCSRSMCVCVCVLNPHGTLQDRCSSNSLLYG